MNFTSKTTTLHFYFEKDQFFAIRKFKLLRCSSLFYGYVLWNNSETHLADRKKNKKNIRGDLLYTYVVKLQESINQQELCEGTC